jgi:hypothetical protein
MAAGSQFVKSVGNPLFPAKILQNPDAAVAFQIPDEPLGGAAVGQQGCLGIGKSLFVKILFVRHVYASMFAVSSSSCFPTGQSAENLHWG